MQEVQKPFKFQKPAPRNFFLQTGPHSNSFFFFINVMWWYSIHSGLVSFSKWKTYVSSHMKITENPHLLYCMQAKHLWQLLFLPLYGHLSAFMAYKGHRTWNSQLSNKWPLQCL